jgi:aspartyl-tRNA(Asn)/glutamyl-tRNA(Gln) amidotransferase subunit A
VSAAWPASVRDLAASVGAGSLGATDVAAMTSAAIARMDTGTDGLHAFLCHDGARLTEDARALEESLAAARTEGRPPPPLAGVPVAVKDNLCTLDQPTTCGSRLLEGFTSPYEATVVRRLRAAGALIAGKTNMDEFGMGSSTENSAFGPTRNPHDRDRVPGGSSGGSAAAVAAGLVPAALGSDTGGSVRQPAALCGVVGLKPTYGAVSRYGLVAFASSLDQVGAFGRCVQDAALVLQAIAGRDPLDATSDPRPAPDLLGRVHEGPGGLVVGVALEYFPDDLDPEIRRITMEAVERLGRQGADIRTLSLPHTRLALSAYYTLAPAEASSNLARFDGVRYGRRVPGGSAGSVQEQSRTAGFGAEVKRRILLGTHVLSAAHHDQYYRRAQGLRRLIAEDFSAAFAAGIDVIYTPTTPEAAFRLGERAADPYGMYLSDVFTVTANLAALPAVSVPVGHIGGLPVGGQLLADRWQEPLLIRAAAALEGAVAGDGGDAP